MGYVESKINHFSKIFNKKRLSSPNKVLFGLHLFDNHRQTSALTTVQTRIEKTLEEESYLGKWYTVDQDCINQFANATGDEQWIHVNLERAKKESLFKTTIAHGFLTLALIPILTESTDPNKNAYPEAKMVINYGLNQVRFPFPIKVGKRIRARTRIIEITPIKRGLEIVREVKIEIEGSTRIACKADVVLRLYF